MRLKRRQARNVSIKDLFRVALGHPLTDKEPA
jgi:hypothetical protein